MIHRGICKSNSFEDINFTYEDVPSVNTGIIHIMQNNVILFLDVAAWQKVEKIFKENVCFVERDTFQVHYEVISL